MYLQYSHAKITLSLKAIGTLAAIPPKANSIVSGLLVAKDYSYTLLDPKDLKDFAGLSTCIITQRQRIALNVGFELVRWHLDGMYGAVEDGVDPEGNPALRVLGAVDVKHTSEHELTLEWESSASNDMIADACLALILGIDKSPASVKLTSHSHAHPHADADEEPMIVRIQRLAMFLEAHFGDVELHLPEEPVSTGAAEEEEPEEARNTPALIVHVDESDAIINLQTMTVESLNEQLRRRVEAVLDMAVTTVSSLAEMYTSAPLSVDGLGKAASDSPAIELLEKGNGSPENEVEQSFAEKKNLMKDGSDKEVKV